MVTRRDLTPGQQIAQVAHAMASFAYEGILSFETWLVTSGYIVVLSVETIYDLLQLNSELYASGSRTFEFREPDLGNELTAIAIDPNDYEKARRMVSHLPLALKGE